MYDTAVQGEGILTLGILFVTYHLQYLISYTAAQFDVGCNANVNTVINASKLSLYTTAVRGGGAEQNVKYSQLCGPWRHQMQIKLS